MFPSGPSWYRIYTQTFTLTPADFHDEPYWSLFFVRGNAANGETFAGNLYVMGADVIYQAARRQGIPWPVLISTDGRERTGVS